MYRSWQGCLLAKRGIGFGSVAVRCIASAMRSDCYALRFDAKLCVRVKRGEISVASVFSELCRGVPWPCRGRAVTLPLRVHPVGFQDIA